MSKKNEEIDFINEELRDDFSIKALINEDEEGDVENDDGLVKKRQPLIIKIFFVLAVIICILIALALGYLNYRGISNFDKNVISPERLSLPVLNYGAEPEVELKVEVEPEAEEVIYFDETNFKNTELDFLKKRNNSLVEENNSYTKKIRDMNDKLVLLKERNDLIVLENSELKKRQDELIKKARKLKIRLHLAKKPQKKIKIELNSISSWGGSIEAEIVVNNRIQRISVGSIVSGWVVKEINIGENFLLFRKGKLIKKIY